MTSARQSGEAVFSEYDGFADIYTRWTDTAASARENLPFYLEVYKSAEGRVVELGVGDGRIAVAAAACGCALVGVDQSSAMLARCRDRAEREGVLERLTLIQADFRDFILDEPAGLIALPYHSIGHLVTHAQKDRAIRHIFDQLRPGGQFVFDDFVMTPELKAHMRAVQLRSTDQSASGASRLLWVTSLIDDAKQSIAVVTWEDTVDAAGMMEHRRYRRLSLSWLEPRQTRTLLENAGFGIEACFGDFRRGPFSETASTEQIWIARKPD